MANKAREFGDKKAESTIMNSENPGAQKNTKIRNYNALLWNQRAEDVMTQALRLKFNQNEDLKLILLQTGCRQIAEAAPDDDYWGCGLHMNHPKVGDPSSWTGQNLLMRVRSELK